ncbi:hypothetical protein [Mesotoga sp. BH458_6_3_2_1]|uniref:hypothetical protein n=1 Tax=Mesotoga sp. BH458_6_3_2_1 TaxID=1437446 RepID=UPI0016002617|nr:hypothetical protein [Mesotoga sp. BH458_6_3_2_1]
MKYKLYQEPYITIIPELEFLSSKRAKEKMGYRLMHPYPISNSKNSSSINY